MREKQITSGKLNQPSEKRWEIGEYVTVSVWAISFSSSILEDKKLFFPPSDTPHEGFMTPEVFWEALYASPPEGSRNKNCSVPVECSRSLPIGSPFTSSTTEAMGD